jgi:hypothetical protein
VSKDPVGINQLTALASDSDVVKLVRAFLVRASEPSVPIEQAAQ